MPITRIAGTIYNHHRVVRVANHKVTRRTIEWLLEESGVMLVLAVAAFILANTALANEYHDFVHLHAGDLSLHFAVNDMLMAFFFMVAAIEIKKARMPGGDLEDVRKAGLPLAATLGGVMGPIVVFSLLAFSFDNALKGGWAIPTATDIAFAYVAMRMLVGAAHPATKNLLVLAVADDAIGLVLIAVFFTQPEISGLLVGLALFVTAIIAAKTIRARMLSGRLSMGYMPFAVPGIISWAGFAIAGVHPALALVPIVWFIPTRMDHEHGMYQDVDDESHMSDPFTRLEHAFKLPVVFILGCFAFVNAGVGTESVGTGTIFVLLALLIGKPVGIFLASMLGLRLGFKTDMSTVEIGLMGIVAGIGFTVAIFVATVSFPAGEVQDSMKVGAMASLPVAAVLAFVYAKIMGIRKREEEVFTVNEVEEFCFSEQALIELSPVYEETRIFEYADRQR